jgi:hypothetical protein
MNKVKRERSTEQKASKNFFFVVSDENIKIIEKLDKEYA